LPPQVDEVCTVGHMQEGTPPGWIDLWLHNRHWVYDREAQAWAVAVDTANLKAVYDKESKRWDGVTGSVQRIMDEYIARHVPTPRHLAPSEDPRFNWELYAYRMFPVRFARGVEEAYEIVDDGVEPLPGDYVRLGLDVVNRCCGNLFECSPLYCNGWWGKVKVNRYCLLDDPEESFRLGRHWSDGKFDASGAYVGPAEPGPYHIIEVWRRQVR
jgi:hypothetical protein